MRIIDVFGKRYGRLLVQARAGDRGGHVVWQCLCDCGNLAEVAGSALANGNTRSCGCLYLETMRRPRTHGRARSRVHRIWCLMLARCRNSNRQDYQRYGGRGISVCKRWSSFENFYADMGEPASGMTLDRIDNNGNYEPSNCRWASRKEQRRNNSANIMVQLRGQTVCLADACEALGKKHQNIYARMRRGSSFEEAIL